MTRSCGPLATRFEAGPRIFFLGMTIVADAILPRTGIGLLGNFFGSSVFYSYPVESKRFGYGP
jgi:hypothetical protein